MNKKLLLLFGIFLGVVTQANCGRDSERSESGIDTDSDTDTDIDTDTDSDADTDTDTDTDTDEVGNYLWHTFYGRIGDGAYSISADLKGNSYITGYSFSSWNGPNGEDPINEFPGNNNLDAPNMFVLKLNTNGAYVWHSFFGTSERTDEGISISLDTNGNIYLAGESSSSWSGPNDEPPINPHSGNQSAFILKLNSDGEYLWHTFYEFDNDEYHPKNGTLSVDFTGNIYIAGYSDTSWNGPDGQDPLNEHFGNKGSGTDIAILKLDSNGIYQWHTFYGSSGSDYVSSLDTDEIGNVYFVGDSRYSWNGPEGQGPLNPHTNFDDISVLKLNPNGEYQWHTFFGSAGNESGNSISVHGKNDISILGNSPYSWEGPDGQSPLNPHTDGYSSNIVVLNLDTDGTYKWHTFHGCDYENSGSSLVFDVTGNIIVTGDSSMEWYGPDGQNPLNNFPQGSDKEAGAIFVLKLTLEGAYLWHTFYGSGFFDSEYSYSLSVDETNNIYVTGHSSRSWNGPNWIPPVNPHNGDVFVLKLSE